jgi:hypothetical protein
MLGLPKCHAKRSIQSMLSEIGVPLGLVIAEATASAPFSSRTAASFSAVSVSASYQLIHFHPGLFAPLECPERAARGQIEVIAQVVHRRTFVLAVGLALLVAQAVLNSPQRER